MQWSTSSTAKAFGDTKERPTVKGVIEQIGFGWGQLTTLVLACGVFFLEGLEMLLVSLLAPSMAAELGAGTVGDGFVVSAIMAGALAGNMLAGPMADAAGRQFPIVLAYSAVIFFGIVSSFVHSLLTIAALRFFVGLGFGMGQPAAIALINEVVPDRWRFFSTGCSSLFFGIGALWAVTMVAIVDIWFGDLQDMEWRALLRCATLPALLLGLASIFLLPESPAFLVETGDIAYARDMLELLRSRNNCADASIRFYVPHGGSPVVTAPLPRWRLDALLSAPSFWPSVALCICSATLSFGLYGSGYSVPQVLAQVLPPADNSLAPGSVLLLALLLTSAWLIVNTTFGQVPSQKRGILGCTLACVAAALAFDFVSGDPQHPPGALRRVLLVLSCMGLAAGPAMGLIYISQAAATIHPTVLSASGIGACLSVGRLGAVLAPLTCDALLRISGRWQTFFAAAAFVQTLSALLLLPADLAPDQPTTCGLEKGAADVT